MSGRRDGPRSSAPPPRPPRPAEPDRPRPSAPRAGGGGPPVIPARHRPRGVDVLYEDAQILVVNKAAGVLTVATDRGGEPTAYSALTDYVRKGNSRSRNRVFIVHRLDRETSGLLVFAKTEEAKRTLQDRWEEAEKIYQAVVEGVPEEDAGLEVSQLAENSALRVYSTPDPAKGRLCKTRWRVIRRGPARTLLALDLLTGRKHQIRVHMADRGWPVAGDSKYGRTPGKGGGARLALHAWRLAFPHPATGERMAFEAPPPGWFEAALREGRR